MRYMSLLVGKGTERIIKMGRPGGFLAEKPPQCHIPFLYIHALSGMYVLAIQQAT